MSKYIGKEFSDVSVKSKNKISDSSVTRKFQSQNKLKLSFEFFDRTHKAFNLGGVSVEWFVTLYDMLKEWTSKNWSELKKITSFDIHPKTSGWKYTFPFEGAEQLEQFQIRVSRSKGRVHGFILDGTFYIVWLDPHHNMTDSPHYESDRFFPPAKSLEEKIEFLEAEIKAYEELLNKKLQSD